MVINRIGPLSAAKIAGVSNAVIGLIIGAIVSLLAMAGAVGSGDQSGAVVGAVLGVGAIVVAPIAYGCMGFVAAALAAWIYNMVASTLGGVEIDIR